jgi:hypothetical protein
MQDRVEYYATLRLGGGRYHLCLPIGASLCLAEHCLTQHQTLPRYNSRACTLETFYQVLTRLDCRIGASRCAEVLVKLVLAFL